jgi:hypothetical protein
MEIFDYINAINYAKFPFLINGSCFHKWAVTEGFSAGKQTQQGACPGPLAVLSTDPLSGRPGWGLPKRISEFCVSCLSDLAM